MVLLLVLILLQASAPVNCYFPGDAWPLMRTSSVYHPQFYPIHKHLFHHVVATAIPLCIHAFINLDLRHAIFTGMLVGIMHDR